MLWNWLWRCPAFPGKYIQCMLHWITIWSLRFIGCGIYIYVYVSSNYVWTQMLMYHIYTDCLNDYNYHSPPIRFIWNELITFISMIAFSWKTWFLFIHTVPTIKCNWYIFKIGFSVKLSISIIPNQRIYIQCILWLMSSSNQSPKQENATDTYLRKLEVDYIVILSQYMHKYRAFNNTIWYRLV